MTNEQLLQSYIARDNARKLNVKKYFTKRNAKIDFYQKFFDKHATNDDKKQLQNIIDNIKM